MDPYHFKKQVTDRLTFPIQKDFFHDFEMAKDSIFRNYIQSQIQKLEIMYKTFPLNFEF